jgi:hypothetical protein
MALRELLDRPADDREVATSGRAAMASHPIAAILDAQACEWRVGQFQRVQRQGLGRHRASGAPEQVGDAEGLSLPQVGPRVGTVLPTIEAAPGDQVYGSARTAVRKSL